MPKTTSKRTFERTITQELQDAWNRLRRKGDTKAIAEELKVSVPIIERALIYGHVKSQTVIDGITDFFERRAQTEKQTADRLNGIQTS